MPRWGHSLGVASGELRMEVAAQVEFAGAVAVGQEAVAADVLEAGRQRVPQEAADEPLMAGPGHPWNMKSRRSRSATRGSRADQGVRPTVYWASSVFNRILDFSEQLWRRRRERQ